RAGDGRARAARVRTGVHRPSGELAPSQRPFAPQRSVRAGPLTRLWSGCEGTRMVANNRWSPQGHNGEDLDAVRLAAQAQSSRLDDERDLDPLMERISGARFVLLGEASHGTSEFYTWRTRITQRLIREKGFSLITVEGDWPDCYRVNRYVKGYDGAGSTAYEVLNAFTRWPTWMWANREVVHLAE